MNFNIEASKFEKNLAKKRTDLNGTDDTMNGAFQALEFSNQ